MDYEQRVLGGGGGVYHQESNWKFPNIIFKRPHTRVNIVNHLPARILKTKPNASPLTPPLYIHKGPSSYKKKKKDPSFV